MTSLPLRIRITAWYFAVLAIGFSLFGVIAYFVMRSSIHETVDENLQDQIQGVRELIQRTASRGRAKLAHEFDQDEEIRAGSDLLQVSDPAGNWVYRSRTMTLYGPAAPREVRTSITTQRPDGVPLRVLTLPVRGGDETYIVQLAYPLDDFYEALDRFRRVLFLSSPLLLLLASAGGYWLSRRALAPVDQITREARSISAQNLSSRLVVPHTGDELQHLSETLNGMLARLEQAFRRITQFTADASHELRTPVALMRTRAEIVLRRPRSQEEYRETLRQILEDLQRTSSLIENLMLLARADSGAEALQRTRINMVESVGEACLEGRTLAETKQISFREELPASPLWIQGDSNSLRRLFLILLDNAVKYTPPQGRITVSLHSSDGCAVTEVRDTGIGIAAEDLPHVFERFFRADRARSRETGGAGLGLSIGQWIAEAHGGTIGVFSEPGEGSMFQVRIPLAGEERREKTEGRQ
jgi:heavy metal sensor kinase